MPIVYIIVPCYNQAHFLQECIESIRAQTFSDWKCIVVDDASTEGSPSEIVKTINDDRVWCVRHDQNKGLAASRNTGFKLSESEFVVTVDSDDMLSPDFLKTLLGHLSGGWDYDCAFGDIQLFGKMCGVLKSCIREDGHMVSQQWIPGAGVIMRRKLWEKVGGYCENEVLRAGNEDWDFWLSAIERGIKVIHIPEPLYHYRKHLNSMSCQLRTEDYKTRELMYSRHKEIFDKNRTSKYFLFCGYRNSAFAHKMYGEYSKSFYLYIKTLLHSDKIIDSMAVILESIVPRFMYIGYRRMKAQIKDIL